MARRSEHSQEQIREMVLNAAETIIIEEGVEALTVRKIAMEIGYTVGSIYMVFANMQDLMMHVKGRTLDLLATQLQQVPVTDDIELQISDLAAAYLDFASNNYNRWCIVFEAGIVSSATLPDWYREKIEQMFAPIESLFRQLTPNRDPEQAGLAARALWCGVHGVCVLSLKGNLGSVGVENADTAVRLLVENFIRGWQRS
ncbi:MAG: TetR/AcrR family transcriptional regulator [Methylomonas sp.]